MAITPRKVPDQEQGKKQLPQVDESKVNAFIAGAPDGNAKTTRAVAVKKQITHHLAPNLIDAADLRAQEFQLSRSRFIELAMEKALKMTKAELLL